MNEHTRRVMLRVISMIEGYWLHKIGLRYLVDSLEASIEALEKQLPDDFYHRWYDHWGALEQFLATSSEDVHADDIRFATEQIISLVKEFAANTDTEEP